MKKYLNIAVSYLFAIGFGVFLTVCVVYNKSWEAYAGLILSAMGIVFTNILYKQMSNDGVFSEEDCDNGNN